MADTLIFKIDTTPTVSALQDVNDLLTQSKNKLKELTDAGKQQTNEYIAQNAEVKALEKEQRALNNVLVQQTSATKIMTKATEDNIKAGKAQENSIAENRKAYNALYNQLIQTAKPTEEQIKTAKELNKTLKEQEAALGNTTRNVGNYGQGFSEAGKQINLFGVNIGEVSKGLEAAKAGFTAAGGGVKGFGAALATTGLPLIIMGIQSLITVFENFKPVADAVEDSTTALGAAFRAIVTGGSIDDIVNSSMNLLNVLRDLEDTQGAFNISQAKGRAQVDALIIASKDRTKSEEDRLKLIEKAEALERDIFGKANVRNVISIDNQAKALKAKLEISDAELKILAEEDTQRSLALRKRLEDTKGLTDEELKLYQTALLERQSLEGELNKFSEKMINARNKIIEKAEAEAQKAADKRAKEKEKRDRDAADAAAKKAIADAKAISDKEKAEQDEVNRLNKIADRNAFLEELRIKTLLSGQEQEEALFELAFEKRIEDLRALGLSEVKIEEIKQKELLAIKEKYAEKGTELTKSTAKTAEEIQTEQIQAIQGIVGGALNTIGSISDILSEVTARKQEELDAALKSGALSEEEYAKQSAELKRKQFEENKAIQLATAVMQGINATLAAYTSGASIPLVGTVTGPLFAALAAAFSAVQIGMIASKQPPRFATGVIGLDGPGTATSDSIDARLSRGESVMTAKATERFAPVLAQMELAVGNRPNFQLGNRKFATGYIPTTDGGYSDRAMSNEVNNASTMAKMFSDSIAKMPQPKLVYDEFTNFVNNRNQSVNLSEL
jgi:hypothetical protein